MFYHDAKACLILFDVNDESTLTGSLDLSISHIKAVREHTLPNKRKIPIFLIGNKVDKIEGKEQLQEMQEYLDEKAEEIGA